jgi:DNA-binding response OmpR family regulator
MLVEYLEQHGMCAIAASPGQDLSRQLVAGEVGLALLDFERAREGDLELLRDIRAVLRRREPGRAALRHDSKRERCRFDGWQLCRRTRVLTDPKGLPVALTKGEFVLLSAFLDTPQVPLTREHLLQATRVSEDVFDRSIDVQVLRLRRKLETDPTMPRLIQTERGVGYMFASTVEAV